MCKNFFFCTLSIVILLIAVSNSIAQTPDSTKAWKIGGGLGFDFAQLLLINPKIGAGENRIGFGGNSSFFANYKKDRLSWKNSANINFGVQKLGRAATRPFQKSIDELRLTSIGFYDISKNNPFSYALDFLFVTQLTPTYQGNYLSYQATAVHHPISQFFAPATIVVSPGMAYKPNTHLSVLLSPVSLKSIIVANDSIAQLGNATYTSSQHGNPMGIYANEAAFHKEWGVKPSGKINDSTYYAKTFLQMGATLKLNYQNKFLKDKDGKARIGFNTSLNLYSNYLRDPQNIDVEWITQTDIFIIKGLSITLTTNLFYDHDILVQLDRDKDINTGVNGYESTGRRVSFTETLLLKYNFLF